MEKKSNSRERKKQSEHADRADAAVLRRVAAFEKADQKHLIHGVVVSKLAIECGERIGIVAEDSS